MNRRCHLVCLALLTLVFTTTYSTNMLVAELFFDRLGGLLPYVLVINPLWFCFWHRSPILPSLTLALYSMNNSNDILLWNHLSLTKKVKYCLGTSHHLLSPLTIFLRCLLVFLFAIYVEFQTKVPLIIQLVVQLSGSSNSCRPSVLKGGHRSGSSCHDNGYSLYICL